MRIRFDKIDGFIKVLEGEIKYWALFDSGLFDKFCDKIKYFINKKVVLQIVLITIMERSVLTDIILYLLKNIDFS